MGNKSTEKEELIPLTNISKSGKPKESGASEFSALKTVISCRWLLALNIFLGNLCIYALRNNINIAIVCMVPPPPQPNSTTTNNSYGCDQLEQKNYTASNNHALSNKLDWDKQTQSIIVSSYFIGSLVSQIPGGCLQRRFGGKSVYGFGMVITVAATLLLPGFAHIHVGLVIFLRIVMGLGTGVAFPAAQGMWGHWAPPLERSKLIAFAGVGNMMGSVVSLSVSGYLCATKVLGGWPLVFYVFGGAALLWLIMWHFLAFSTPNDNPYISEEEKTYLNESIGISSKEASVTVRTMKLSYKTGKGIVDFKVTQEVPTPWASIFTSPAVWAITIAHACCNWGEYTLQISLPSYMHDVLKFEISKDGLLSALPFATIIVTTNLAGQLADYIRSRGILGTTSVRKLFQTIGFVIPAVLLTAVGFVDRHNHTLPVLLMTAAVAFTAGSYVSFDVNHVDIAPRFSGILYGITNAVANFLGIIAPIVIGAVTTDGTRQQWRTVFGICAVFYIIGAICYLILGSGEEQPWNSDKYVPFDLASEEEQPWNKDKYVGLEEITKE